MKKKIQLNDSEILEMMQLIMKNINFLIILFFSGVMLITINKIADTSQANIMWDSFFRIVINPQKMVWIAVVCYIEMLLLMKMGKRYVENELGFFLYSMLLTILAMVVIGALGINCNSIILLVIADLMRYWKSTKLRVTVIGLLILIYIVIDVAAYKNVRQVVSMQSYLVYYTQHARYFLSVIRSVLISVNVLLFMLYMIVLMQLLRQENERISELNKRLDEANEQLKEYAKNTEKMVEARERNRLAREIHDTLGHSLINIIAGIDASIMLMDIDRNASKNQLKLIADVARNGMKDVRRSVKALRPDALETLKLKEAIAQIVKDTEAISGAEIILDNTINNMDFAEDEEDTIYRTIQESLTNAIRHGHATKIEIHMKRVYNIVNIMIKDNGIGSKEVEMGFGLRHMKERIELLNGTLTYDGNDGFMIMAHIPIRWGKRD